MCLKTRRAPSHGNGFVMRFSSNEGQNMAPDVILILIKEGRVAAALVMVGVREHIVKYN